MSETKEEIKIVIRRTNALGQQWSDAARICIAGYTLKKRKDSLWLQVNTLRVFLVNAEIATAPNAFTPDSKEWKKQFKKP